MHMKFFADIKENFILPTWRKWEKKHIAKKTLTVKLWETGQFYPRLEKILITQKW